jgi:ADP-heptose:LPS heptosyltransferase
LQNCKLFLGGDSGSAHLAAAVRCPMLVLPVPKQCGRHYLPRMETENPGNVSFFPDECWNEPDKAVALATQVAASTLAGKGVTVPGAWKLEQGHLRAA